MCGRPVQQESSRQPGPRQPASARRTAGQHAAAAVWVPTPGAPPGPQQSQHASLHTHPQQAAAFACTPSHLAEASRQERICASLWDVQLNDALQHQWKGRQCVRGRLTSARALAAAAPLSSWIAKLSNHSWVLSELLDPASAPSTSRFGCTCTPINHLAHAARQTKLKVFVQQIWPQLPDLALNVPLHQDVRHMSAIAMQHSYWKTSPEAMCHGTSGFPQ